MLIIGVTGNIACGKSTVDAMLHDMGATAVIDADQTVRALLRDDLEVRNAILQAFGPEIVAADGTIDRARLGDIVFADAHALRTLESITHPAVRRTIRAQLAALPEDAIVVVDAVKLLEGELGTLANSVWWVTARPEQQLERLVQGRGLSEQAARARMAAQPSLERWRDSVNVVIDNSGSLAHTRMQVSNAYKNVLATRHG